MNESQVALDLIGEKSTVHRAVGVYRGVDGSRVLVDFDDRRIPAYSFAGYVPELNEPVWVEIVDGVAYMGGPTVPKPSQGVVASVTGGIATVTVTGGTITATAPAGIIALDIVKLYWANGAHILAKIGSTAPPVVPPAPTPAPARRTQTFTAIDSGSFDSRWWTGDVYSSASNRGAWFYGSKIRDTIPPTAWIASAEIYLPPPKRLLGARPFGRHGHGTKPAGAPSIVDTSTLGGTSGWVSIPTGLVDALKAGTGGVGFALGGYNIWPGVQADGQSGALRITFDS